MEVESSCIWKVTTIGGTHVSLPWLWEERLEKTDTAIHLNLLQLNWLQLRNFEAWTIGSSTYICTCKHKFLPSSLSTLVIIIYYYHHHDVFWLFIPLHLSSSFKNVWPLFLVYLPFPYVFLARKIPRGQTSDRCFRLLQIGPCHPSVEGDISGV